MTSHDSLEAWHRHGAGEQTAHPDAQEEVEEREYQCEACGDYFEAAVEQNLCFACEEEE